MTVLHSCSSLLALTYIRCTTNDWLSIGCAWQEAVAIRDSSSRHSLYAYLLAAIQPFDGEHAALVW